MILDNTWRSTASRRMIPERANCDFIMDGSNSQVWLNTCTHAHMHMHTHTHTHTSSRVWENIVTGLFATMWKRVWGEPTISWAGPLPRVCVLSCVHPLVHPPVHPSLFPLPPRPPSPPCCTLPSQRNQGRAQVMAQIVIPMCANMSGNVWAVFPGSPHFFHLINRTYHVTLFRVTFLSPVSIWYFSLDFLQ